MNIFQKHARGVLLRKFRDLEVGPDLRSVAVPLQFVKTFIVKMRWDPVR